MARTAIAAIVFLFVGTVTYTDGLPVADAALRAMGGAVAAYFVSWGAVLWLCSELYNAQVANMRNQLLQAHRDRNAQIESMYLGRMSSDDSMATTKMEPPPSQRAA
jgi:hypothetical protein